MSSDKRIETGRRLAEQPAPPGTVGAQPVGGGLDRAVQHARAAAVERVDAVDFREPPGQAVTIEAEPGQELRADGHRVDRRAVVVQQAGNDRLAGARATADFVGGFQDGDLEAGLGEGDRGGQAVRPGPHDDRVSSCLASRSLRSSLVPRCDPHSRSASGAAHASAP